MDEGARGAQGCSNTNLHSLVSCSSALSDDTFTYKGVEYQITYVGMQPTSIILELDKVWPAQLLSSGTVHADNRSVALSSSRNDGGRLVGARKWFGNYAHSNWRDGQKVLLSLTDPSTAPGVRATAGDGLVALQWDNPNFPGPGVRRYRWEYQQRAGSGNWSEWQDIPGMWDDNVLNRSPYEATVITGLRNGTAYSFRVRGLLDGSPVIQGESAAVTPKASISPVRFERGPGTDELTLVWTPKAETLVDLHQPRAWGGYRIEFKKATEDWKDWDPRSGFAVSYTIMRHVFRDLEAGTAYTARVWWNRNMRYPDLRELHGEATATTGGVQGAPPAPGPALTLAWVQGAVLSLRFDTPLDRSSVPAASAFAVSVAGAARSVSAVEVDRDTVNLTLGSAVFAGDTVTVGYTPPSSGGLRAGVAGGAAVAAFSGRAVTNTTPSAQPQKPREPSAVGPPDNEPPAQPNALQESPPGDPGQPDPAAEPDAPMTRTGTNGRDDIPGGDGDDLLIGLRGGDVLRGKGGHDELRGGHGHDKLLGGAGDDVLLGGKGDDELRGGRGADRLFGGDGDDTYTGGPGADRFIFESGDTGDKIITDFGDGNDLIVLTSGSWPAVADIVATGVAQGSQYYVYTLSAGLTVETDTPLRTEHFVLE